MSLNPEIQAVLDGESDGCIVCADCLDVMADMPDGCVDAVVTDPPYGIGEDGGLKAQYRRGDGRTRGVVKHEPQGWDKKRPDPQAFALMLRRAPVVMFFGGNYFADLLPASPGWLYWDKRIGGDFSDGELIYTNRNAALRSFSIHAFSGLRGGKDRQHPTQKPIALMEWCLGFIPDAVTILDPFCGSGTTCVAAKKLGKRYIGIEISPKYAEIARRRVRNTPKPLFIEPAQKPKQSELFAEGNS